MGLANARGGLPTWRGVSDRREVGDVHGPREPTGPLLCLLGLGGLVSVVTGGVEWGC